MKIHFTDLCGNVCQIGIQEERSDKGRSLLKSPESSDRLALKIVFIVTYRAAETGVLNVIPHPFSRFAMVQGSLDEQLHACRLSAGRVCSGWWSGLSGCGHAIRREAGRRGRCGHGRLPQTPALTGVSGRELWTSFPEANRKEVLGLLSMFLERLAVSEGAGDEHSTAA